MLQLRIEGQANFLNDRLQKSTVESKTTDSFVNVIKKSQSKLQLDSINQLMTRVDTQGQQLAKQRTLENLREYKNIVKQFIRESLSYGLQLSDKKSFNSSGGMKSHQIVEVIDQKLIELQDEVLMNEKEGIEILSIVGEVKGLLINLYM